MPRPPPPSACVSGVGGKMKVTVTFGRTGVVVPCKEGWTVRDLIQQATQRYRKLLEQEGDFLVRTHHVEYCDGGILDPDDILTDLVEDRDKLIAVYEEQEAQQRGVARGNGPVHSSPEPSESEHALFQPIRGGEIEVNSSALKSNTPLLVRSSSDSALSPLTEAGRPDSEDLDANALPTGVNHVLMEKSGGVDKYLPATSSPNSTSIAVSCLTRTVEISGDQGPLGIHVVPYCSSLSGRTLGLYIRGVEENSRSKREGIFHDDECIISINGTQLMDKTFAQSQEVFRQAMRSPTMCLEVVPVASRERYEKSLIGHLFSPDVPEGIPKCKEPLPLKVKPMSRSVGEPADSGTGGCGGPPVPASLSPASKGKADSPVMKKSHGLSPLAGLSSKKGGRRLKIDLKKGPEGLGFTVVTRDSSVHGPGPILVKNILPRGAAVKDGRLQSGDRILEVNGVDITGCTQEELVAMLRSTKQGECVSLVVSRQEEMFLPRELKEEQAHSLLAEEHLSQLMFEVPLNDSGSAGLGVSLKGNKSRETGEDLGIFIKSVIHGGAAYKDGRLRVNDQLVAVNGESLLGKSNHEAMETLRRSMSMEGNLRGMIQLVVLRVPEQTHLSPFNQEQTDVGGALNRSIGRCSGHMSAVGQVSPPAQPGMVINSIYERAAGFPVVSNGGYGLLEEGPHDGEAPHLPSRQEFNSSVLSRCAPHQLSSEWEPRSAETCLSDRTLGMVELCHVKASKSMDLVADESNVGALVGQKSGSSVVPDLGPMLGLKKSSSLESLQTAVSEAQRGQALPFHRPRPHMVRGRGCNESFRAAIDKSYDGPPEDDDDDVSESSGRDTPASGSSRQGLEEAEESKKDKRKKGKGKKKDKAKGKVKEKKKAEDGSEESDKKTKKKGFGLLRFGKKKEDKVKEGKGTALKQSAELLSDEELERMKEERERIEAKHQELRDKQGRDRLAPPDVEDDDMDPNYARINTFRDRMASPPQGPYQPRSLSPQGPLLGPSHSREPSSEDPLDGLYAKVNKQRAPPPLSSDISMDRIQQLRREYQQARRDGTAPFYEELEARRRGPEYDPQRMPVRSPDQRLAPRYEDVERQYASLPRRGPMDPVQSWGGHRDQPHYPSPPQPVYHPSYPTRDKSRPAEQAYYAPPPHQRGPLRQDVPPSPPVPPRAPRYDTMNRSAGAGGAFRSLSPERYAYRDPRQKNPMTAAV
ncbi:partitioning defective 3 homolog B isoform X3 [Denticeps clupeoides]|uniref:Par-3 family cell polarity regulator beta b n=1 Tax=Denticeps clupeoides TaxID=299321 RepID=A0AAY4CQ74_9TELE|nr:partitioning defective 3 homolog B-like isoform X3 [Denticeps clupeoides]